MGTVSASAPSVIDGIHVAISLLFHWWTRYSSDQWVLWLASSLVVCHLLVAWMWYWQWHGLGMAETEVKKASNPLSAFCKLLESKHHDRALCGWVYEGPVLDIRDWVVWIGSFDCWTWTWVRKWQTDLPTPIQPCVLMNYFWLHGFNGLKPMHGEPQVQPLPLAATLVHAVFSLFSCVRLFQCWKPLDFFSWDLWA